MDFAPGHARPTGMHYQWHETTCARTVSKWTAEWGALPSNHISSNILKVSCSPGVDVPGLASSCSCARHREAQDQTQRGTRRGVTNHAKRRHEAEDQAQTGMQQASPSTPPASSCKQPTPPLLRVLPRVSTQRQTSSNASCTTHRSKCAHSTPPCPQTVAPENCTRPWVEETTPPTPPSTPHPHHPHRQPPMPHAPPTAQTDPRYPVHRRCNDRPDARPH